MAILTKKRSNRKKTIKNLRGGLFGLGKTKFEPRKATPLYNPISNEYVKNPELNTKAKTHNKFEFTKYINPSLGLERISRTYIPSLSKSNIYIPNREEQIKNATQQLHNNLKSTNIPSLESKINNIATSIKSQQKNIFVNNNKKKKLNEPLLSNLMLQPKNTNFYNTKLKELNNLRKKYEGIQKTLGTQSSKNTNKNTIQTKISNTIKNIEQIQEEQKQKQRNIQRLRQNPVTNTPKTQLEIENRIKELKQKLKNSSNNKPLLSRVFIGNNKMKKILAELANLEKQLELPVEEEKNIKQEHEREKMKLQSNAAYSTPISIKTKILELQKKIKEIRQKKIKEISSNSNENNKQNIEYMNEYIDILQTKLEKIQITNNKGSLSSFNPMILGPKLQKEAAKRKEAAAAAKKTAPAPAPAPELELLTKTQLNKEMVESNL